MTKEELCMRVWELEDVASKAAARRIVEHIIDTIKEEVASGNEVNVSGLGKFYTKVQKERSGVSTMSGGKWTSPEKKVPKFRASSPFKSLVVGK